MLIPLHAAGEWIDDISANLADIPSEARVVLSDVTGLDGTLSRLERRHAGDARLRFRRADRPPGWRRHINALIAEVQTELFAVLPQDDRIPAGYYERLIAALDRTPGSGLAYGPIDAEGYRGMARHRFPDAPFPLGVREPWREIVALDRRWNLGIPFRGVWRRHLARPIPETLDDFADQLWVLSVGLVSHLVEVREAVYRKRYHAGNTHQNWVAPDPERRRAAIEQEIDGRLTGAARDAALALLHGRSAAVRAPQVGAFSERPAPDRRCGYRWIDGMLVGSDSRSLVFLPLAILRGVRESLLRLPALRLLRCGYRAACGLAPEGVQRATRRTLAHLGFNMRAVRLDMRQRLIDSEQRSLCYSDITRLLIGRSLFGLGWAAWRVAPGWIARHHLRSAQRKLDRLAPGLCRALGANPRPGWLEQMTYRAIGEQLEGRLLAELRSRAAPATRVGLVSVVREARAESLIALIEALRVQTTTCWSLALIDATPDQAAIRVLAGLEAEEPRLYLLQARPEEETGELLMRGCRELPVEFIGVIDAEDSLPPGALQLAAEALDAGADLLYGDDDRLDARGLRHTPHLKPDYAPDTLRASDVIGRLWLLRRSLLFELGGFDAGCGLAIEYDLLLRAGARARRVVHLPHVLYHWRASPPAGSIERYARSAQRACERQVRAEGGRGAQPGCRPGAFAARYPVAGDVRISVVIPTRDRPRMLARCVRSVLDGPARHELELVIVDNGSSDKSVEPLYAQLGAELGGRLKLLRDNRPFNYSALNNSGVEAATGEVLLLLNNDIIAPADDWVDRMLEHALRPEIGIVGAWLVYPGGALQHAGVTIGLGGLAGHVGRQCSRRVAGSPLVAVRNVSAVTGACMMLRRSLYRQLGGLDPGLPVAFNDVDLCLRARQAGYRVLVTPHARLVHKESVSRGADRPPAQLARGEAEQARLKRRWATVIEAGDPYYHPLLTLRDEQGVLRLDDELSSREPA